MAIGHPAYYDNTPENIYPFANDEQYHELEVIQPHVKSIPLKAPFMEAPAGKFAVSAFNPLLTGHHYTGYWNTVYDESEVEDVADRSNWAYLAIRENLWPVSNDNLVVVPAQPVTPDIYRQTLAKYTSPSLAGSAPTQGIYTGIGGTAGAGAQFGYEPL
jgi:hypothetical protein